MCPPITRLSSADSNAACSVFFDWCHPNVPGVHAADNDFTETLLYFAASQVTAISEVMGFAAGRSEYFCFVLFCFVCLLLMLLLMFCGSLLFEVWGSVSVSVVKPTVHMRPRLHKTISTKPFVRVHRVLTPWDKARTDSFTVVHFSILQIRCCWTCDSINWLCCCTICLSFLNRADMYVFFPLSALANSARESDLERVTLPVYGFC